MVCSRSSAEFNLDVDMISLVRLLKRRTVALVWGCRGEINRSLIPCCILVACLVAYSAILSMVFV